MKIKQCCEDFVVVEDSDIKFKTSGAHTCYLLRKKEYTTLEACELISEVLGRRLKDFGYAGTKDRKAITTQVISIKNGPKIVKKLANIELDFLGYKDEPVHLGELKGNKFTIVVRDLDKIKNLKCEKIVNYFGTQRFSTNNVEIGKLLLTKKFSAAAKLINEQNKYSIDETLQGLHKVPIKLLRLYVHSVQSKIWNEAAKYCVENNLRVEEVPLVGFGIEIEDVLKEIISSVMESFGLSFENFVVRAFPELSCEGDFRKLLVEVSDFKFKYYDDELNAGKKKAALSFTLPKGSYATELIQQLLSE